MKFEVRLKEEYRKLFDQSIAAFYDFDPSIGSAIK